MDRLKEFKQLSLVKRVMDECEKCLGAKEKVLADFIIDLAKKSENIQEFQDKLAENGAEFEHSVVKLIFDKTTKIYNISKMPKKNFTKGGMMSAETEKMEKLETDRPEARGERQKEQEIITQVLPSLAMPNIKKEEINLDLDFDKGNDEEKKSDRGRKSKHQRKSSSDSDKQRRNKRRSPSSSHSRGKNRRRSRYSRSHSRERKRRRSFSRDPDKKDRRHESRRRHRRDSKSRSPSDPRRDRHSRRRERDWKYTEESQPKIGSIYRGVVRNVPEYGAFVALDGFRRKEGLCHVSQIKIEGRLRNASDMLRKFDKVFVKVIAIKEDGKISLSMKEVDQVTGRDLNPAHTEELVTGKEQDPLEQLHERGHYRNPVRPKYGDAPSGPNITGITNDINDTGDVKRVRRNSNDMWEITRLQGGQVMDKDNDLQIDRTVPENLEELDEEDQELERNEEHAPFLRFSKTKTGISLSPIRIAKNPDGSLNRVAMKQGQFLRERKADREQKLKELKEIEQEKSGGFASSTGFNNRGGIPEWKKKTMGEKPEYGRKVSQSMREQKEGLPIYQLKADLIQAINDNRILVVIGETGSGKTTQMTQYMVEMGLHRRGRIGCTQPRRVAAMSVAKRVSEEFGCRIGQEVGYCIRFEDCTSPSTIIKYMTDGMLLREALIDSELNQYSCIILDEAHERTLDTDVLFGLLKKAMSQRDDLKLIVTSATLDAVKFSEYFNDSFIFRIPGRMFPVKVLFSKAPQSDYLEDALQTVQQIHLNEPRGDILVFLTGQEEIDTACQVLYERMKALGDDVPELIPLPVYSALPSDLQSKIFEPAPEGSRKCIVATNIAEASLTIDGIFYVVDPGFAKIKVYNPKLGMDTLEIAPISQASANQRAGRAGRTGPGKCYRLYTEDQFHNEMLPSTVPEIQRTNLANTVLVLKAMGINDLIHFDFMDPPPIQTLITAMEELYNLGALDDEGLLTKLGRIMAEFPLAPQLSKMLLTSVDLACSEEAITIVAMLSVQNIFYRPRDKQQQADQKRAKFFQPDGDHLTMLCVYDMWKQQNYSTEWCFDNFIQARGLKRAQDVRKQLISIMERYKLKVTTCRNDHKRLRKAIAAGFFTHAAKKDQQEGYRTVADNQNVYIHPSSSLFNKNPDCVVYHELVMTSKEYMRDVCCIDAKWLTEVAPKYFKTSDKNTISKRKKQEKIVPLHNKYEDPDAWRLSRRKLE
ncbi:unnamed protein product [Moneuplotes crassus]|uniref:RNA helicase n=2 Tax=Euplotes crassus TaxID=5936 RepID=A0AAD1XG92_EUPCR|nr:unnamed protein product [Moneuplotes crassus]